MAPYRSGTPNTESATHLSGVVVLLSFYAVLALITRFGF
jgi:hypothetical protein